MLYLIIFTCLLIVFRLIGEITTGEFVLGIILLVIYSEISNWKQTIIIKTGEEDEEIN